MSFLPRLIEVAMPVKEISAECVRDKSIRQGHISTLHLWWARRPLPVCRAVVFASLVPDPENEQCPESFKEVVALLLGAEKNPRQLLLSFIATFSDEFILNEKNGKTTAAKKKLSPSSLIKWDNKQDEAILKIARQLIWVAHNCHLKQSSAKILLEEFDSQYNAIKKAEVDLFTTINRHLPAPAVRIKEKALLEALQSFQSNMPIVYDPFAGGGAIPLEAARLGCRSYGNDLNPVAYIIQKGSVEFPQRYGKSIVYSKPAFLELYNKESWDQQPREKKIIRNGSAVSIQIDNRLSFDVDFYARKLLEIAKENVIRYYPSNDTGKLMAYHWSYFAQCANPECHAHVPLLPQLYLCNRPERKVHIAPIINGNQIELEIKEGVSTSEPYVRRKNLWCPCCGQLTGLNELKQQFKMGNPFKKIVAVIEEGVGHKVYRLPTAEENDILQTLPVDIEIPQESIPVDNNRDLHFAGWGPRKWGDMFSSRQLLVMHSLINALKSIREEKPFADPEYGKAVFTYLGIFINRLATRLTSFGLYNTAAETIEHPFGRQAVPFVFDFPEVFPFSNSGGGGLSQLDWIIRFIEAESSTPFSCHCSHVSGEQPLFEKKSVDAVITDPPYYDAIAYADLSDFFYVWLKRSVADLYPETFATELTPKLEECTALKHYHDHDAEKARLHFENKLTQIFSQLEAQTSGIISIMYAHQNTNAWTTLCNALLASKMIITGSWPIESERTAGTKVDKAFLSSSMSFACRPVKREGIGDFDNIKNSIETKVSLETQRLYGQGFRSADLLTACFGLALGEFGKFEKVMKSDGSEATVSDLLDITRQAAEHTFFGMAV